MKDTKDHILMTAYQMFMFENYEAVTISSIIKATGLTKGAIYHYFDSKEDLFKAVVDKYMLETRTAPGKKYSTLKEFIQIQIENTKEKIAQHIVENPHTHFDIPINLLSLIVAAYRYYPGYAAIGNEFIRTQIEKWAQIMNHAMETGEIRNDIDIEATISSFTNIHTSIISNIAISGSLQSGIDLLERQYWQLYNYIKK